MNNVVIATFRHRHEGQLAQGFLSDAGIRSVITADNVAALRPDLSINSLVRVLVRVQDAERARMILANTEEVAFE
jgi:hypothetical protein